ncbi:MAG: TerB family tellurite resistance protein [Myxococcota bacterium]
MQTLTRDERLLLMRFVCSFAWADLEVKPEERELVRKLVHRMHLGPDERQLVEGWLDSPPSVESIDPTQVPREHRMKFLRAVESVISVDGEVSPEERESLILFAKLVR